MQTIAIRPRPAPVSPLARIVHDLAAAGIQPTPLSILGRATDEGLSDAEISAIVEKLSAARDLAEVQSDG